MEPLESNLYLNFTKSIVDGFEEFVVNVEKHGDILKDYELRSKLKIIGKKLQTIFNKWENTTDKKSFNPPNGEITPKEIEDCEVPKRSVSFDDFDSMIASCVGDDVTPSKVDSTEISSTSDKLEFSIIDKLASFLSKEELEIPESTGTCPLPKKTLEIPQSTVTYPLSKKEAEIVRKFGIENVKKEWIVGSNGFYVEQISPGSWKCNPCKREALSYANIISHASGKGHIKKLDNYNREASLTRQSSDIGFNSDLSFLSEVEPELMKKDNGADIIVPFKGYYCNACRGTLNSEEALKLHISGGKHRKNCES